MSLEKKKKKLLSIKIKMLSFLNLEEKKKK